jgi:hypothetical protein
MSRQILFIRSWKAKAFRKKLHSPHRELIASLPSLPD